MIGGSRHEFNKYRNEGSIETSQRCFRSKCTFTSSQFILLDKIKCSYPNDSFLNFFLCLKPLRLRIIIKKSQGGARTHTIIKDHHRNLIGRRCRCMQACTDRPSNPRTHRRSFSHPACHSTDPLNRHRQAGRRAGTGSQGARQCCIRRLVIPLERRTRNAHTGPVCV